MIKQNISGGLIHIGGGAGYARTTIDTDTEVNVAMKYTTTKETLTLPKKTPMDFPEECYDERFTHVVTSVCGKFFKKIKIL